MIDEEKAELLDAMKDIFHQACYRADLGGYYNYNISAYEAAQIILVKEGFIKEEECLIPTIFIGELGNV